MAEIVAFVAGATGYTGRALVPALRAAGAEVVAHVRPDSPSLAQWRERFDAPGVQVDTTAWELEAMTARLRSLEPTHVFALLGTTRTRAKAEGLRAKEAYDKIDYGLTMLLYEATKRAAPRARFVYLSVAGVRPDTANPYVAVRWRVESALREGGTPYTIVRPSFITGGDRDEKRPLERTGAVVSDGILGVAAKLGARRLAGRYRSMTGEQLAAGITRVALDPAMAGQVVHAEQLREG